MNRDIYIYRCIWQRANEISRTCYFNFQNHSVLKSHGMNMFPRFGVVFVFLLCYCCLIVWGTESFKENYLLRGVTRMSDHQPQHESSLTSNQELLKEHHQGPTGRRDELTEAPLAKLGSSRIKGGLGWMTQVPAQSNKAGGSHQCLFYTDTIL